jgi:hypothetical protein
LFFWKDGRQEARGKRHKAGRRRGSSSKNVNMRIIKLLAVH